MNKDVINDECLWGWQLETCFCVPWWVWRISEFSA